MSESPRLYHVTAHRPDAISCSTVCNFTPNVESLVVARGQWLEVMEIDEATESLVLKCRFNCFAVIRAIDCLKVIGDQPDRLVVNAQSSMAVLSYDHEGFSVISSYTNPETVQLRSAVPGEYLAVDPYGRSIVSAALEHVRLVHIIKDGGQNESLKQDEPIESLAANTFIYELVSVDRGYESPAFAVLERIRYGVKQLSVYEANIGLGHVTKLWSTAVSNSTHWLIALPDPLGFIVFDNSTAQHYNLIGELKATAETLQGRVEFAKLLRSGSEFFVFVQTDSENYTLRLEEARLVWGKVNAPEFPGKLQVLEMFKLGFLFAAGTSHKLYQVSELNSAKMALEDASVYPTIAPVINSTLIKQRQLVVGSTNSAAVKIFLGQNTDELASTPLPAMPTKVFTARYRNKNTTDDLIVLSFADSTTVLDIGEDGSVEEASESTTGLASNLPTLAIRGMVSGIVQIHSQGLRYVSDGIRVLPWLLSSRNLSIVACSVSTSQVAVALSDKTIVYFEEQNGMLLESQRRLQMPAAITAMVFTLEDGLRSSKLIIGLEDETVREWSMDSFKQMRIFNVQFPIHCLLSTKNTGIYVGHANGTVSQVSDEDIMVRVLGSKPVSLAEIPGVGVVAVTSRAWLITDQTTVPLHGCQGLTSCHSFTTEDISQGGIVGITDSSLEVLSIPTDSIKSGIHNEVIGTTTDSTLGLLRSSKYIYACQKHQISVIENTEIVSRVPVSGRLKAFVTVRFESKNTEYFACSVGRKLAIYSFEGNSLVLLHETALDNDCLALLPFRGKLVAAIKNRLVLFELGQRQLLFQEECLLGDLTVIKCLRTMRNLIYVGDSRRSVVVVSYDDGFNVVGVDPVFRSVSSMVLLDLATVCIGDHYGNIAILRFSGATSVATISNANNRSSSPTQLDLIAHFWVPDAIVQLHKGMLSPTAGTEAIIYVGLQGTVGLLIPFLSVTDYESYSGIESALTESHDLIWNSLTAFRGQYTPCRNVVDGDFCEHWLFTDKDSVKECLESLNLTLTEAQNKVLSIRARSSI